MLIQGEVHATLPIGFSGSEAWNILDKREAFFEKYLCACGFSAKGRH